MDEEKRSIWSAIAESRQRQKQRRERGSHIERESTKRREENADGRGRSELLIANVVPNAVMPLAGRTVVQRALVVNDRLWGVVIDFVM